MARTCMLCALYSWALKMFTVDLGLLADMSSDVKLPADDELVEKARLAVCRAAATKAECKMCKIVWNWSKTKAKQALDPNKYAEKLTNAMSEFVSATKCDAKDWILQPLIDAHDKALVDAAAGDVKSSGVASKKTPANSSTIKKAK